MLDIHAGRSSPPESSGGRQDLQAQSCWDSRKAIQRGQFCARLLTPKGPWSIASEMGMLVPAGRGQGLGVVQKCRSTSQRRLRACLEEEFGGHSTLLGPSKERGMWQSLGSG